MNKIVLASSNPGKLREFAQLLAQSKLEVIPQSQFEVPEVAETGLSFVENALLKARQATQYSGLPALADDSGIAVDALQGAPGIYSARFAGPGKTDEDNNALLIEQLTALRTESGVAWTARYHCVIVLMRFAQDPMPLICQGTWEGQFIREPRGQGGFGYDPWFWLPTLGCTAAELSAAEKNKISHRAQALRALLSVLKN